MSAQAAAGLYAAAVAAHQAGRLAEAESAYRKVLAIDARHAGALHLLGVAALQRGDPRAAIALVRQALAMQPDWAEALEHVAMAHDEAGELDEALAAYARAMELAPGNDSALTNRGALLLRLRRLGEAADDLSRATALQPANAAAWVNLSAAQRQLHQLAEAIASADRALQLEPQLADAWLSRGNALLDAGRAEAALQDFRQALSLRPAMPAALNGLAESLRTLKRHEEAAQAFAALLQAQPAFPHARAKLLWARRQSCDWAGEPEQLARLAGELAAGQGSAVPFTLLPLLDDPALHLRCAREYARSLDPGRRLPAPPPQTPGKIRVAYLSADFHEHATAYLMAELFERHDRTRFEVTAVSFGPDDGSAMRARLVRAFDHFLDASNLPDEETARWMHARGVHIAVDLKGYTQDARPAILGWRPAPVQVQYIGYPGTMGAEWIDYLIADGVVVPEGAEAQYTERIVRLPHCYQPNDASRPLPRPGLRREEAGLPEDATVFCCFNNSYKISAPVFDRWMRILARVAGSVLWLLEDTAAATRNLRREAAARGIDPGRLVFAPRVPLARHMDRHLLADLFLDTAPYGAHTTASDALWCGLPVLTCPGHSFASRVAASLVRAAGLPQLAVADGEAYEAEAVRLGQDAPARAALRAHLVGQRGQLAVFDAARLCRSLEAAYVQMDGAWRQGGPVRGFAVDG